MEFWQLNIILVLLVAVFTRKDMAILTGCVMLMGWYVGELGYSQSYTALMFCGLNSFLALTAASYNHIKHCNLSIVTSLLACVATIVNLIQMYDITVISSIITGIAGWGLLFALILMDGDKGLINGFLRDFRICFSRLIYNISHYHHDKGRH